MNVEWFISPFSPQKYINELAMRSKLKEWPSGSPDITGIGDRIQGHRPWVIGPRNVQ